MLYLYHQIQLLDYENQCITICFFFLLFLACNSTKSVSIDTTRLEGTWQLSFISGTGIAFDDLYSNKKPTINFNLKENKVSGNNSCNSYFGVLLLNGNKINFKDSKMGMTMMSCPGMGESAYMKSLEKVDSYSVSEDGKTLNFIMGNMALMRFEKASIDIHNSQNSLDWQGIYTGLIPCADCEGIETQITLNANMTFVVKSKYLSKGNSEIVEDKGNFCWDKSGGSVSFEGLKGKPFEYKVEENRLIQLDMNGEIINGTLTKKYELKKIK